ncbi:nucleotidyltransferase [Planococcus sp. NCCP-2050]|uniref:nucleotidyltransferase n=1 Tax=Planococcus sp. NCCP-2050 TaxID=2944679 RepID=UPI00203B48E6|nr:nucleotidyltransferase [Planococcus sp. NCCP-2050]GKW46127.1 hypothetical protein NCCP2050_18190 [Planococcus sp. NCCP-2050]
MNMKTFSSYIMLMGTVIVALSGNWVLKHYDTLSLYPKPLSITFGVGWLLIVCAYILNIRSPYHEVPPTDKRDNRDVINQWERHRKRLENGFVGIALVTLVLAAFSSWSLVFDLFFLYFFIGMVAAGFLFVMQGDRVEGPDELNFKGKTKKFLDVIDYRRHPFSLSLILFTLIVGSFVVSKEFGIPFYMEVSGDPRYATDLPNFAFSLSSLLVVSGFIYIINNGDLFGIRKAKQNGMKVLFIHFFEIIFCGASLFIWLFIVIEALVLHY